MLAIFISYLFKNSNRSKGGISLCFWFAFAWWLLCWTSFHMLIGHLCTFFGEMSIQVLCSFKKSNYYLFSHCWFIGIFYILWKLFIRYMVCKYFLLFCRLLFHSGLFHWLCRRFSGCSLHLAPGFPSSSVVSFSPEMVSCWVLFVVFQEKSFKGNWFLKWLPPSWGMCSAIKEK